jgi:hypothetical protein
MMIAPLLRVGGGGAWALRMKETRHYDSAFSSIHEYACRGRALKDVSLAIDSGRLKLRLSGCGFAEGRPPTTSLTPEDPMNKIKLDLADLEVRSFEVVADAPGHSGTVEGFAGDSAVETELCSSYTFFPYGSCYASCRPSVCDYRCTNPWQCFGPTVDATCDGCE